MSLILIISTTAAVTTFAGYLVNNLAAVPNFPGKNWLLLRLLIWVTLIPVVHQIWSDKTLNVDIKTWTEYGIVALAVVLVVDLWNLHRGLSHQASAPLDTSSLDLRTRLLKVFQNEVAERLEDSLNQQVIINLMMHQQLEKVNRRRNEKLISLEEIKARQTETNLILLPNRTLRREGQTDNDLDPQESIFDTFDRKDVGRKLLILGAPGSGKTTTLLKLAERLLEEALQTGSQLIPLIFELSTWKNDKQSIHDWLIEQLKLNYNVSPEISKQWLAQEQLLPLLDGLDELGFRQKKCVEHINNFIQDFNYPHCVVCCRSEEYNRGQIRLEALKDAVCLQPLSNRQIKEYLRQLKHFEIWKTIQQYTEKKDSLTPRKKIDFNILRIPLFLNIFIAIFQPDVSIHDKKKLLSDYTHKQLDKETRLFERSHFSRNWVWKDIKDEPSFSETSKYLNWLSKKLSDEHITDFLIEKLQPSWIDSERVVYNYESIVRLIGGILFALVGVLCIFLSGEFLIGLTLTFILGSLGFINGGLLNELKEIVLAEKIRLELRQALRVSSLGFLLGLPICITIGIGMYGKAGILGGVVMSLLFSGMVGFLGGFEGVEIKEKSFSNQGIWNSLKSFILSSLCVFFLVSLTFLELSKLLFTLFVKSDEVILSATEISLLVAIFFGLLIGLELGGQACLQHFVLRLVLTHTGKMPWNYTRFLNYCVERRLMQRIGGRYRFIHKELLEHFAGMEMEGRG
ncbi:MAG: NACHT domain-containing protein [Cyanobacteria bacterium P01_A01_bin.114]